MKRLRIVTRYFTIITRKDTRGLRRGAVNQTFRAFKSEVEQKAYVEKMKRKHPTSQWRYSSFSKKVRVRRSRK